MVQPENINKTTKSQSARENYSENISKTQKQYLDCNKDVIQSYNSELPREEKLRPRFDGHGFHVPEEVNVAKFKHWIASEGDYVNERIPIVINKSFDEPVQYKQYAKQLDLEHNFLNGFYLPAGRSIKSALKRLDPHGYGLPDLSDSLPSRAYLKDKVDWTDREEAARLGVKWDSELHCSYLAPGYSIKAVEKWRPVTKLEHGDRSFMPVALRLVNRTHEKSFLELKEKHPDSIYTHSKTDKQGKTTYTTYAKPGSDLEPFREANLVIDDHLVSDRSYPLLQEATHNWTNKMAITRNARKMPDDPSSYETIPGANISGLKEILAGPYKVGREKQPDVLSKEDEKIVQKIRAEVKVPDENVLGKRKRAEELGRDRVEGGGRKLQGR